MTFLMMMASAIINRPRLSFIFFAVMALGVI